MYDVVAIGELLIDFTPFGSSEEATLLYGMNPGGAPSNVVAFLAKMGIRTALIGKVGDDQFGEYLINVMREMGVDTKNLVRTEQAITTMAFVHLDASGNRSFSFCRKPGADMLLEVNEIKTELLKDTFIFHFGTVSMTHTPSREATFYAVRKAKESGSLISFDPNLRLALWDNIKELTEIFEAGVQFADILKISDEELEFISGISDPEIGTKKLFEKYNTSIILVTLGDKGCFYRKANQIGKIEAYRVNTVDTTGAGDAFLGAFLYKLCETKRSIHQLDVKEIEEMIDFANASGALVASKKGSIFATPSLETIEQFRGRSKS